jgi:hypothetical protein
LPKSSKEERFSWRRGGVSASLDSSAAFYTSEKKPILETQALDGLKASVLPRKKKLDERKQPVPLRAM